MRPGLLVLRWSPLLPSRPCAVSLRPSFAPRCSVASLASSSVGGGGGGGGGELTAREKRQLRRERRESKAGENNWREEVEERLSRKPKKQHKSWTEKLNLDYLALLGTQWWVVRVSRVNGQDTAERLARSLVREFPGIEFKVYFPAIRERRKLKNGSYTIKSKPLFPGCVFLNCIMNKEIHDFIRECDGIGGFVGAKVGNTKRQINKPKPVAINEMEAIFRQAKDEQEKYDKAFENEQQEQINSNIESANNLKPKSQSKNASEPSKSSSLVGENDEPIALGSSVRVLSGPFTEFAGRLKGLDYKTGKATVGFMLFGKESTVDMEVDQIVVETT